MLKHSLGNGHQYKVDDDARYKPCQGVDEIMRLDVNRCHAEEYIEWKRGIEQLAFACVPKQEHADGAHTHVRTWESSRRTFAGSLGVLYELIENTIGVAWCG